MMGTMIEREKAALHGLAELVRLLDPDPGREGLAETPGRVMKALREMTRGHRDDPAEILSRTFESDGYDEMVVKRGIPFHSLCEHHMLPVAGVAHVGYIPGERVVGLSKLSRLVDCYARRLQIQERLTVQIADAIVEHLSPVGAGVVVIAQHSCVSCRGVGKDGADMVTSALRGALREDASARAEFLRLAGV